MTKIKDWAHENPDKAKRIVTWVFVALVFGILFLVIVNNSPEEKVVKKKSDTSAMPPVVVVTNNAPNATAYASASDVALLKKRVSALEARLRHKGNGRYRSHRTSFLGPPPRW
ncbi:MAG: hypothetical protein JWL92_255 [Candidatus Nomurabacteria bacterium]|nr:hypothetical protein [Candidatus Nomurabacteria bacterium]